MFALFLVKFIFFSHLRLICWLFFLNWAFSLHFAFVIWDYVLKLELKNALNDYDSFHISIQSIIMSVPFLFSQECPTRSTRTIFFVLFFLSSITCGCWSKYKKIYIYWILSACLSKHCLYTVRVHQWIDGQHQKNLCFLDLIYNLGQTFVGGGNRQHEKQTW